MAARCGLTLVKRFPYRGDPNEEFSNTYYLYGVVPGSHEEWLELADAMGALEQPIYPADVEIVRAYGYATDNPDDNSVWGHDYVLAGSGTLNGTLVTTGDSIQGGDSAVWVRWPTSRRNTAGKVIYLRKYFHPAVADDGAAGHDTVAAAQKAALMNLGLVLYNGTFLDARQITSQQHDEAITGYGASTFVTTRTLKRRGKRPNS